MSAAQDEEERARVVEILAPVAVDSTYSYLAPAAMRLSPGDSVTAPLGTPGGLWRRLVDRRRLRPGRESQDGQRPSRPAAAFAKAAQLHRLAGALHADAARHGAAARHARGRRRRARDAAHALSRDGRCPGTIDADARPRSQSRGRRRCFRQESACRSRRLLDGRHRRARRRGRAGGDRRAAGADLAAARSSCSPRRRWSPRSRTPPTR